jgi:threonine aldolase
MKINLVSDTVTKPSQEMLRAMFRAEVGDDVYKQDPTVIQLEAKVAEMFGMEQHFFFLQELWLTKPQSNYTHNLVNN